MAKNLNMQMTITADTSQAKREMKSLQEQLSKLNNNLDIGKGFGTGFTKDMQNAKAEIAGLQVALKNAVNVDTGKLDFTKFNQQLKMSGQTLNSQAVTLNKLGPEGQQAFLSLSKAIAKSEIPLRRVGTLTKELGTTLANTVKWQISSSAIHSFMGAIQGAYNYAKELDKSLNNIKIVTGQSADQMARFAYEANKTAQELSTTTTDVTNAALIYYQQGLSNEEVEKRTKTTLKLANVTRQSAEEVSSQLTAIWNNFDDGSETLESYADKITALGAATASSSSEIAEGLQKFAAVADTINLSYDQATAALATVVAQTRQSADVVGTAFKTLFARLEGLKLGDTLEDGTTLNQYSKALETVGVNIFKANGQLKDMDNILDELGAKWKTLDQNSQVALAQTVGGMRQYNQLIALMDSYDIFKQNVNIARNAEGALQEQQERFETGWEASTKRVQAAWEELYDTLVDKDFFTGLNDGLAGTLNLLNDFIENLGGLKGLLVAVSPILLNLFGDKLQAAISNATSNLVMMIPGVREMMTNQKNQQVKEGYNTALKFYGKDSIEYKEYDKEISYQKTLEEYGDKITAQQKEQLDLIHEQEMNMLKVQKAREDELHILQEEGKALQGITAEEKKRLGDSGQGQKSYNQIAGATALSEIGYLDNPKDADVNVPGSPDLQTMGGRIAQAYQFASQNKDQYGFSDSLIKGLERLNNEWEEQKKVLDDTQASEEKLNDASERLMKNFNLLGEITDGYYQKITGTTGKATAALTGNFEQGLQSEIDQRKQNALDELNKAFAGKAGYRKGGYEIDDSDLAIKRARVAINNYGGDKGFIAQAGSNVSKAEDLKMEQEALKKALKKYEKEIEESTEAEEKIQQAAEDLADKEAEKARIEGKNIGQQQNMQADIKRGNEAADLNKNSVEKLAQDMKNANAHSEALSASITNNVKALASFGSAMTQIQSLQNVWKGYSEGSVSFAQALGTTLTTISTLIPTISTLVTSLQKAEEANSLLSVSFSGQVNEKIRAIAINKLYTASEQEASAAEITETKTSTLLTAALKKQAAAHSAALLSAGAAIAVIAGLIAVYQALKFQVEGYSDAAEAGNKQLENIKEQKEKNKNLQDQLNILKNLKEEYKNGIISESEYSNKINDTIETIKEENEELGRKLEYLREIGNIEGYGKIVEKYAEEAENEQYQLNQDYINTQKDILFNQGMATAVDDLVFAITDFDKAVGRAANTDNGATFTLGHGFGFANEVEKQMIEELKAMNLSGVYTDADTISVNPQEMSSSEFAALMSYFDELNTTGRLGTEETNNFLEDLNKLLPTLSDNIENLVNATVENNRQDYKDTLETAINTYKENNPELSDEQIYSYFKDYIKSGRFDQLNGYMNGEGEIYGIDTLTSILGDQVASNVTSAIVAEEYSPLTKDYLLNAANNSNFSEEQRNSLFNAAGIDPNRIFAALKIFEQDQNTDKLFEAVDAANQLLTIQGDEAERYKAISDTIGQLEFGKTFDKASQIKNFAKAFNVGVDDFEQAYNDFLVTYEDGTATFIGDTKKIKEDLIENLKSENLTSEAQKITDIHSLIDQVNSIGGDVSTLSGVRNWSQEQNALLEHYNQDKQDLTKIDTTSLEGFSEYLTQHYNYQGDGSYEDLLAFTQNGNLPDYLSKILENKHVKSINAQTGETSDNLSGGIFSIEDYLDASNLNGLENSLQIVQSLIEEIKNSGDEAKDFTDAVFSTSGVEELEYAYSELGGDLDEYRKRMIAATKVTADALDVGDEYEEYTEYLMENNEALAENEALARQTALSSARLSKGIEDLNDNFESYEDTIENSEEDSQEYAEAIKGIEDALQNVFGTDDSIDPKFIKDNLKDIKKLAEGDEQALLDLRSAYAKALLEGVDLTFNNKTEEQRISLEKSLTELQSYLDSDEWGTLTVGMELDDFEAGQKLQQFVIDSQMSVNEAQNLVNSMGFEMQPITRTIDIVDPANGEVIGQKEVVVGFASSSYVGAGKTPTAKSTSSKGKSGSSRSKKDKKDYKDEFERYYTINRQIQDQIDEVERLGKAKDRAQGKAKLELLDKESDALQTQIDLQNEKIKQVEQYYKYDQERLNFFGAQYDENGVVTNYDEMVKREVDAYNAAVDRYNNGGGEGAFSMAEDRYNKFKEILEQYDETNQLWQEEMDKLTDLKNEYYDMQLEKIQTKVEMDIEVDDSDLKVLEYELDRIRKKAFSTAEAIAKIGEQLDVNLDKQKVYNDALEDILANHGISDIGEINNLDESTIANLGFTADEIDALQEYNESLLETQKELNQLEEDILNGPLEAFKEWNDEFDYQEDKIENNINLLKQYKDIADLIYSNSRGVTDQFLYGIMNNTYNNMVTGVGTAYTEWQANKAALTEAMAAYEESIAAGADEQTITLLRNNLREMEEMVDKSRDDMLKKTEEALKQAEDLLKQFVENAAKAAREAFSATEWDMTKFDRLKTLDDEYLDDYEKIYELSKLTRDVNNSMDSMDTIRGKERLKEITQEIAEIEESNKEISQYEVDALRKKYELRLAEIALEDAQAAKNTVRMSRDNDGNWSYVYTADDSKVDKARQNYEDKLYEYQKLNSDFIKNQQENFLKLEQEYTDAMQKIAEDSSLNEEDKLTRLQETQAYYQRMAEIMTDQLGIALDRNSELYHKDWLDYSKMTDYKISKLEDYQTQIEFTYTGYLQPNIESAMDLLTQFTNATVGEGGYFPQIVQGLEEFKDRQDEVLHAAGTTLEDYATYVEDAMYAAGESSVKASDEVSLAALTMREAFDQVIAKINELNQKNLSSVRSDIETTVKSINKLIGSYKDLSSQAYSTQQAMQSAIATAQKFNSTVNNSGGSSGGGSGGGGSDSNNSLTSTYQTLLGNYIDSLRTSVKNGSYSDAPIWREVTSISSKITASGAKLTIAKSLTDAEIIKLRNYVKEHDKTRYNAYKFDTGGYTGSWGAGGRLAMLHQKELVLNAHDTENMLNTIQMVRDIVASIDTRAAAAGAMNINAGYAGNASAGAQDLNQNVHIEASFPNATDHNEIELALTNLVNRASQYAGRKKP